VYLGQADNVRARLQQYGRTGSHLDTGNQLAAVGKAEINAVAAGPGLFREVFSKGYSLMFRCALVSVSCLFSSSLDDKGVVKLYCTSVH
jgi:hypothetical protein